MVGFVCVKTGTRYGPEYVYRLKKMLARHAPGHPFVCLTDDLESLPELQDNEKIDCRSLGLKTWWLKMAIFMLSSHEPMIYFDLDTVIVGDLSLLIELASHVDFSICENFTRAAGNHLWPCQYGSCVMTLRGDFQHVWYSFQANRDKLIAEAGVLGDQWVIEKFLPGAVLLQRKLPRGFFLGYRDLTETQPAGSSVVVFAGPRKPHNTKFEWVRTAWER